MCGIVGVLSRDRDPALLERTVVAMRDEMRHRGPDDAGVTVLRDGERLLALGHRRLSIIDLSPLGHQPMSTADGSHWIVFNGEIFNYQELRRQLPASVQASFRSQSDTEVILYAAREWGVEECLRRLRGMYAFALYDVRKGLLTLVRDPLGVKPLYYVDQQGAFAFASEIKALLALPGFSREIHQESLYHYLTFANAPAPYTFFEHVRKLEAGSCLTLDRQGRMEQHRFWDPAPYSAATTDLSEQECIEEIRRLLRQSVKRRMVSDVPFGVFLSGGVDSSLNVALMAELLDRPVETFSIGIKDDPTNEFEHARQVATHFKTHHHEAVIDDRDFIAFLPEMARLQDEPVADPVCVPIYYISRVARESGTPVIQVGEGSDEIFAGYQTYHLFDGWDRQLYRPYLHMPGLLRQSIYAVGKYFLPAETQDALRRAGEGEPLFLGNAIAFWDNEKSSLLKPAFVSEETSSRWIDRLEHSLQLGDPLSRIIQIELKNRLPELLLMRVDKMSMANSIETRVPFLDEDLVAFALSIPSALKYKHGRPKYILKEAARGIIPDSIIDRKKWGFCGSATNMLSPRLVEFAKPRILDSPLIAERFNRPAIEQLFHALRTQKRFNSFKIWNLLNLVLWHEQWFTSVTARRSVA
ncbi:MAG: asparagine synthase (glutamine-hydrolyzing) [Nitrospiraceae bacterium]|nr:asparagine synthase (glutamine-hydrolyzing) [Nitrospiraceae bacterium]